jgi:hypothetical protein
MGALQILHIPLPYRGYQHQPANATVLEVLSEKGLVDPRSFDNFKNGSDGEPGTEDDRLYRKGEGNDTVLPAQSNEVTDGIELLKVRVEAMRGEAQFVLQALVTWSGANPGAADTRPNEPAGSDSNPVMESDPNSATEGRNRARGNTRTAPSTSANLGYPFRFVRITENRNF